MRASYPSTMSVRMYNTKCRKLDADPARHTQAPTTQAERAHSGPRDDAAHDSLSGSNRITTRSLRTDSSCSGIAHTRGWHNTAHMSVVNGDTARAASKSTQTAPRLD